VPANARGGGGVVKLVVAGVIVAFVLFYVMTSPSQAADIVHTGWNSAVNVAHGIGDFVDKLAS
jgi:hypothetical protein